MTNPIDLYFWPTPNCWKVSIALEEMALPYDVKLVNIYGGDQKQAANTAVNPNAKVPSIVDPDGPGGQLITVFESGAILLYLARKTGQFYGTTERQRIEVDQWLMWQMGNLGPMAGQVHHFVKYAPYFDPPVVNEYGQKRYVTETRRLYQVLDRQLAGRDFVCGDYSIADMAIWPWASLWEGQLVDISELPNMEKWLARCQAREGVAKGRALHADLRRDRGSAEIQKHMFNKI